jgi:hypothetical protein
MTDQSPTSGVAKLQFNYIKSPDYREVLCNGVFGGVAPNQKQISMSIFAERAPIPRTITYDIPTTADGVIRFDERTSQPSHMDSRNGIVRHVECTVYLDLDTAKNLRAWLDDRIATMEAG